jgi:hypothetical protein
VRLKILMAKMGQGMGRVTEAGEKTHLSVFAGDYTNFYPGGGGDLASDCVVMRSPFMGEHFGADDADEIVARHAHAAGFAAYKWARWLAQPPE